MANFFDDLARRRPDLIKANASVPSDFEGAVQRLIADEVARQVHGLPKPADQKPLPRRIQAIADHMQKTHAQVPAPAPSSVPAPAPVSVPKPAPSALPTGEFGISVLNHDRRGRIQRVRFDAPDGKVFVGVVNERDGNGRISRASFALVA